MKRVIGIVFAIGIIAAIAVKVKKTDSEISEEVFHV